MCKHANPSRGSWKLLNIRLSGLLPCSEAADTGEAAEVQPAVRSAHARHPAVWPRPLRLAPDPPDPFAGHSGAKIRQKCGTILFRFNSEISLTQMQPPYLISESLHVRSTL